MDRWEDDSNEYVLIDSCVELDSNFSDFYNAGTGNSLKLFHSNIRSYVKNINELFIYLNDLPQLDLIILTECWLSEGEEGFDLDGFDLVLTDKQRNQNDGTVIYANKRLNATHSQITIGDAYGISLNFNILGKQFNLLGIYRTFDCNCERFITELGNYYEQINKNVMCILAGDMNIELLHSSQITDEYFNCLTGFGLLQCINKPTRDRKSVV